jgi:salicylate hydroxylase
MAERLLIAGGGIGGLAAGFAAAQAGWDVQLFERAPAFTEVGAGVQLGPNVTRILNEWGLSDALKEVAACPEALHARSVTSGAVLSTLPLGAAMQARYGAPYVSVHRADLHALLLQAAQSQGVVLQTNTTVLKAEQALEGVTVHAQCGAMHPRYSGQALVVADGVWSPLRQQLLQDGPPTYSGHLAYRALVPQAQLPQHLRTQNATVWMGALAHVVVYPVRGGDFLNVVCLVEAHADGVDAEAIKSWTAHKTPAQTQQDLHTALRDACTPLRALIDACHGLGPWQLWPLCARPPMQGAFQQAQGRMALLGDAAHPMLPYLAQGAGMAIEDAAELGAQLTHCTSAQVPQRLAAYAQARWQRNARVQARAIRNGRIFHATGPLRWGRDLGLRMAGARLMDTPWLYGDNC